MGNTHQEILKKRMANIAKNTLSKNPLRMKELGGWIKVATTVIYSEWENQYVEYSSYSTSPYNEIHYRRTDRPNYANELIILSSI